MITPLRTSGWLAVGFGVFLCFGETVRNWGAWGSWETYTFDYLFASLLIGFGRVTLSGARWAHVSLTVTWGLTAALFSMSLLSHIAEIDLPTNGPIPHLQLTIIIGVLDGMALMGLVLAVCSFFRAKTLHSS